MGLEQLKGAPSSGGNPESRENLIKVDRIEPVDVTRTRGLYTILRMFKENRDHLAGITNETTIFDIYNYYRELGRHGFVGLSNTGGLVGVYDLSGPEITRTRRGGQDVELTLGFLNRMCVRTDLQRRGVGQQLTEHALHKAHNEYGWSNLLAGIVLDETVTQRIQRARATEEEHIRDTIFRDTFNNLKETDARVKLFVVRNGFQYSGFHPNVTVGGQVREVLLISQPRSNVATSRG